MVLSMSNQDDLRPRYPMSRRAFVSMVTAGAASTLIQGTAAAAQPLPKARNVVLVRGLFADGSSWSEVIPRLQAAGLNVTSVQNPLTTLPEAVASAERVLARQDGRTVLAGHSFSGIIVTEAGVHPNVSALVYVAARAPDAGEDYTALAKTFPTPPSTAGIVFDGDEGRLSEAAFLRDFEGDLPEGKAKVLYAVQEEADRKQCPRRFRRSPRRLRLSQRQPGMVEKGLAGGGQLDAAHAAADQLDANLAFEIADLTAEGRLRRVQPFLGRERQAALFGGRDEKAKVP
jgi:pimeloyl-ACP methyl ester carboxylesterase